MADMQKNTGSICIQFAVNDLSQHLEQVPKVDAQSQNTQSHNQRTDIEQTLKLSQQRQAKTIEYQAMLKATIANAKKQSTKSEIIQAICFLLMDLLFGTLFLVYSCLSDLHNGTYCHDLKDYCYEYGIALLIGASTTLIQELSFCKLQYIKRSKSIFRMCIGITLLVFWILLWVALAQDESCGELRTLALIYNWIVVGILGLGCCCSITMLVFDTQYLKVF